MICSMEPLIFINLYLYTILISKYACISNYIYEHICIIMIWWFRLYNVLVHFVVFFFRFIWLWLLWEFYSVFLSGSLVKFIYLTLSLVKLGILVMSFRLYSIWFPSSPFPCNRNINKTHIFPQYRNPTEIRVWLKCFITRIRNSPSSWKHCGRHNYAVL